MQRWLAMINNGFGRCQECLKPFYYSWWLTTRFPLKCRFCGKDAVLRVERGELSPDDQIIIYNEIKRLEDAHIKDFSIQ